MERRIDLSFMGDRVFVNNASVGLYAKIVQSDEYRNRKLGTALDMLPAMLGPQAEPFDLRFTGPDGTEHESAHVIFGLERPLRAGSSGRLRLPGGAWTRVRWRSWLPDSNRPAKPPRSLPIGTRIEGSPDNWRNGRRPFELRSTDRSSSVSTMRHDARSAVESRYSLSTAGAHPPTCSRILARCPRTDPWVGDRTGADAGGGRPSGDSRAVIRHRGIPR